MVTKRRWCLVQKVGMVVADSVVVGFGAESAVGFDAVVELETDGVGAVVVVVVE